MVNRMQDGTDEQCFSVNTREIIFVLRELSKKELSDLDNKINDLQIFHKMTKVSVWWNGVRPLVKNYTGHVAGYISQHSKPSKHPHELRKGSPTKIVELDGANCHHTKEVVI